MDHWGFLFLRVWRRVQRAIPVKMMRMVFGIFEDVEWWLWDSVTSEQSGHALGFGSGTEGVRGLVLKSRG